MEENICKWYDQMPNDMINIGASHMAQWVKDLSTMQETQETGVWFLGWEDSLEEGMATHSNILAWRIPWTEEPGQLQSIIVTRVGRDWSDWAWAQAWSIFAK